jgi:hypothetical protein
MNPMLFNDISRELGIARESYEDNIAWQSRITYSLLALQMLSALYDKYDDFVDDEKFSDSVSNQHISNRAKKLSEVFGIKPDKHESILELYQKTGFMLNKSNRLAFPPVTAAPIDKLFVARGLHPSSAITVSGIGFLVENVSATVANADEMFNLSQLHSIDWHKLFMKNISTGWKPVSDFTDVEFLNTQVKPWKSYWTGGLPNQRFALCRSIDKVGRVYKLLSIRPDGVYSIQLSDWNMKNGEYLRLAIAMRVDEGNPPKVKTRKYGKTAIIDYDYLLPPAEQNFIEVYSWNRDNSQQNERWPQSRIVAIELYQAFMSIFQRMGYEIEEE